MRFHDLPQTDLRLSVLCLGAAEFGSNIDEAEAFAMLDEFAEAGGNWADTAHVYAAWLPEGAGQSERTVGRWLQSRAPQKFHVATKVGHPDLAAMEISRLSPEEIAGDFAECLERLQRSFVDVLYLHRDDESVPVSEIMDALNREVQANRAGALGASNWTLARVEEANAHAQSRGLQGFSLSQPGWSLASVNASARGAGLTLQMSDALLQRHRETGFPAAAYSSQANGFFAYPLAGNGEEPTAKQKLLAPSYDSARNRARHQRAAQLAGELGRTPNEVALAYVWSQSFPAWAIIGPRRVEQLRDSLHAADLQLSLEQITWLEGDEPEA